MAKRRMYSTAVVHDESFMQMSAECQTLYFYLNLDADDDGFVQPKGIMRMIQAKDESLKILMLKGFIIGFPNQIVAIRHWQINNTISPSRRSQAHRRDEYRLLQEVGGKYYLKTKNSLDFKAWNSPTLENNDVLYTDCIQLVAEVSNKERKELSTAGNKMHKEDENKINTTTKNQENTNTNDVDLGVAKNLEKIREKINELNPANGQKNEKN